MSTFRTDIQGLGQRPANPFQVEHIAHLLAEYERAIAEGTRALDAIQTFADALNEMLPDLLQTPAGRACPKCGSQDIAVNNEDQQWICHACQARFDRPTDRAAGERTENL